MSNNISVCVRRRLGEVETVTVPWDELKRTVQRPRFANGDISELEDVLAKGKPASRKKGIRHVPTKSGIVQIDYFDNRVIVYRPGYEAIYANDIATWLDKSENEFERYEAEEMIRFIHKIKISERVGWVSPVGMNTIEDLKLFKAAMRYLTEEEQIKIYFRLPAWKIHSSLVPNNTLIRSWVKLNQDEIGEWKRYTRTQIISDLG